MKKDIIRDYATAAFRFYAANGMSSEQFKEFIRQKAMEEMNRSHEKGGTGISKPTETQLMAAENELNRKISEVMDMEAVDKVIAQLRAKNRKDIVKAIEIVYFTDSNKQLKKNDIKDRVNKASMDLHMGEATVYRYLGQARKLFALERGLRL